MSKFQRVRKEETTLNRVGKKRYASIHLIPDAVLILSFFTVPSCDMRPRICPYGRLLPTIGNGLSMFIK
jgi:hypothetical protein